MATVYQASSTSTYSAGSTPIAIAKYDISNDYLTASNPDGSLPSPAANPSKSDDNLQPYKYLAFLGLLLLPLILGLLFFLHHRRKKAQWKSHYRPNFVSGRPKEGVPPSPSFRLSVAKFPVEVEQQANMSPATQHSPSSIKKSSFQSFRPSAATEKNGVFAAVHAALKFRSLVRPPRLHDASAEERASLPHSAGAPEVCSSPPSPGFLPPELPASIPPVEMGGCAPTSPIDPNEEITDPHILEAMRALPYMPAPAVVKKPSRKKLQEEKIVISACPTQQTEISEVSRQHSVALPSPVRIRAAAAAEDALEGKDWEGPKELAKFLGDANNA